MRLVATTSVCMMTQAWVQDQRDVVFSKSSAHGLQLLQCLSRHEQVGNQWWTTDGPMYSDYICQAAPACWHCSTEQLRNIL